MDEFNGAIKEYFDKWQTFVAERTDRTFFAGLQPTSIGWKTADRADFDRRFAVLRDKADQIHLGWVNERWLATFHLKDDLLEQGITLVKLMERRPGSTDAVGLDHVDFYVPAGVSAKVKAAAEPDVKWTEENNGDNCKWLSIWFAGTEAKLRGESVLSVCIAELKDIDPVSTEGA